MTFEDDKEDGEFFNAISDIDALPFSFSLLTIN